MKDINDTEGVIKFNLKYSASPIDGKVQKTCCDRIKTLSAWRMILRQLGLIGQDPLRYEGLGFGNISIRVEPASTQFLITGTQTGAVTDLHSNHFSLVTSASPEHNSIAATGEIHPSSEAMTHASIYQAVASAQTIVHIHHPLIWTLTDTLGLASTDQSVAYGTPEMAKAVRQLTQHISDNQTGVFSMLGHEDGVIAYGRNIKQVAETIIELYAQALIISGGISS
ncbi:MAG: class II aldolase/adducin family protein [Gammaproteobacteria bacterium]|nr:class II aldolase/adducin family protein [Gammaproteobacteria bacterium]